MRLRVPMHAVYEYFLSRIQTCTALSSLTRGSGLWADAAEPLAFGDICTRDTHALDSWRDIRSDFFGKKQRGASPRLGYWYGKQRCSRLSRVASEQAAAEIEAFGDERR